MTRVLHVIDQPANTGPTPILKLSAMVAEADRGAKGEQHAWLLVGCEPIRDAARAVGLDESQCVLMPPRLGFRRAIPQSMNRMQCLMQQADRIECWTAGAYRLATALRCAHATPRFSQATLSGFAKAVIERAAAGGDDGVSREDLRQRWGVDDETSVLALLADQPDGVDVQDAVLTLAFIVETLQAAGAARSDLRLLCHPLSKRRRDAAELSEYLHFSRFIIQDAAVLEPWRVLPACDAALAICPSHAGLSILWANALGLPVVTPPEPYLPLLNNLDRVRIAASDAPRHLANPLTKWAQSLPSNQSARALV